MKKGRSRNNSFLALEIAEMRDDKFIALTPAQRIIYFEILATASQQECNGRVCPGMRASISYSKIRKKTGISSSTTIAEALKIFEEQGFIERRDPARFCLRVGDLDATGEYIISDAWKKTKS